MSIFTGIENHSNVPVIEGYGDDVSGAIVAVTESYQDQLGIIKAIHSIDAGQYAATLEADQYNEGSYEHQAVIEGYAAVYESAVGNVFEKIKAFFKKLWTKVKSFFHAVRRRFDLMFKDTASFVSKYESDLKNLKLSGMKATMFNYTVDEGNRAQGVIDAVDTLLAGSVNTVQSTTLTKETAAAKVTELDKAIEDIKSEARGKISGSSTKDMNDSEYSQALFSLFRDGAKGKEDKDEKEVNINTIITQAKGSTALLKVIDAASTNADARYKKLTDAADKAGKAANTAASKNGNKKVDVDGVGAVRNDAVDSAVKLLQKMSTVTGLIQGIESKYYTAWQDAVKERNAEFKSVIGKALRYKEKK